jgi:hypothetical protein
MVLKFENNRIVGRGSFPHKDNLKANGCKWDKENKCWYVPEIVDKSLISKIIEAINEREKEDMIMYWEQACENCGYKFAKKGTPEYEEVKEEMKRIIKNEPF